jgi:dolichol-phosphate mannosyltransferase
MPIQLYAPGTRRGNPYWIARISLETVRSNGYAFQVEMLYRTVMLGGRVRELPITFTDRTHGSSKMSSRVIVEALALPWRVRSMAVRPASAGVAAGIRER